MTSIWRGWLSVFAAVALGGCTQVLNEPLNPAVTAVAEFSPDYIPDDDGDGATVIGLAFSGGGTRAAAFAYGVLRELDETPVPGGRSLADSVRMISGVSGGSVTAAYFGLKGAPGFRDLRERFLIQDAEASMHISPYWPPNIARALSGGVNDRSTFAAWLDENVFGGARYASLRRPGGPIVWINASDIFNKTPFLFTYDTFAALCSDLNQVPVSEAVAASAAFPIVFAPVVIKTYGPHCGYRRPDWLVRALADPAASVRLKAYSEALENYQNINRLKFVKLLDGGLTDNFGVTGFALSRAASQTPYGPLSPRAAVRLRTLLFLVANAGRQDDIAWAETLEGPSLGDLMSAVSATAIDSSVRDEFDALRLAVTEWRADLVRYRCGLSKSDVRVLRGTLAGWDCRDVSLFVDEVTFGDLDPALRDQARQVPTRLSLPIAQVDVTIEAGREALRRNNAFQDALANLRRLAGEPGL